MLRIQPGWFSTTLCAALSMILFALAEGTRHSISMKKKSFFIELFLKSKER